ncbi:MAG: selenide, water dikinase SelD [Anaerolineaceae bacterium]|nr:selenide, water dikinase SelD [Anaerolineaceae bacterium]
MENLYTADESLDLLVGLNDPDDAAVWKIDEQRALVMTTDFFTPVVDDPYDYGAIAAANSLSDIYAMGAKPFLALNIVAFPADLPNEILTEIIRGGAEKAKEAGVIIAGGHSITDKEPKYGLAAVGFVDPDQMMTKAGAKSGDVLMLTKPLGMGVVTTAQKQQKAAPEDLAKAVSWMSRLNSLAAEIAVNHALQAGTDVTGYSLLGHGWEMAQASKVGFVVYADAIPVLEEARKYASQGIFPGGAFDNKLYFEKNIRFADEIEEITQLLFFDPQTSGGLLLAVPPETKDAFLKECEEKEQPVWVIGEVVDGNHIDVV